MRITNDQRAAWAGAGLLAYATGKEGGAELYDEADLVLSDFLTDLMHFAQRRGIDFHTCMDRATTHYHEERAEEHGAADADLLAAARETAAVLRRRKAIAYDRCIRNLEALIARAERGRS